MLFTIMSGTYIPSRAEGIVVDWSINQFRYQITTVQ